MSRTYPVGATASISRTTSGGDAAVANQLPKLPSIHDDHRCDYVACLLCGEPGKVLVGVWLDIALD